MQQVQLESSQGFCSALICPAVLLAAHYSGLTVHCSTLATPQSHSQHSAHLLPAASVTCCRACVDLSSFDTTGPHLSDCPSQLLQNRSIACCIACFAPQQRFAPQYLPSPVTTQCLCNLLQSPVLLHSNTTPWFQLYICLLYSPPRASATCDTNRIAPQQYNTTVSHLNIRPVLSLLSASAIFCSCLCCIARFNTADSKLSAQPLRLFTTQCLLLPVAACVLLPSSTTP